MRKPRLLFAALLLLGPTVAYGQQTPAPASAGDAQHVAFCNDAVGLYRRAANVTDGRRPTSQPMTDAVNIVTLQLFRNGAMDRILSIATAARCNLAPFIVIESSLMDRVTARGGQR